jgi:pyridinium-3,5-biscarboxylic acid mononucleotide synthase
VKDVLRRLLAGELTEAEAIAELRRVQLEELDGQARLDLGREGRRGIPEVVMASGKAPEAAARLAVSLAREQGQGLVSRLDDDHWAALDAQARAAGYEVLRYHAAARVLRQRFAPEPRSGRVALLTAGTSDLDAADEARMVIEACGLESRIHADLGVAGLHRLLGPLAEVLAWDPDAVVVAAGMDGVLPGVVAGLLDRPVIGLPVSTGYGRGGAGEAALGTMLQSCSTGLLVVNIDNGVGAGAAAALIARRAADRARASPRPGPARARPGSGGPARRP